MNDCKHNNVHIDATVTLYADRPRADGSYVLGVSGELHDGTVQTVTCVDCGDLLDEDEGKPMSVETWLRDFYSDARPRIEGFPGPGESYDELHSEE